MKKNNSKKKKMMKKFGVFLALIFLCSTVIYSRDPIFAHFSEQGIGQEAVKTVKKELRTETEDEEEIEKLTENVTAPDFENESETEICSEEENESETQTDLEEESEAEVQTDSEEESETEVQTHSEEESEEETQISSEEENQSEQQTDLEEESEAETPTTSEKESETETNSEEESESETGTILEENIPFQVILLIENGTARAPGQAQVDTFGQIEILGARTSYKHNKETFQTIYCLNYARNGAYGIYGSDRTAPVHASITYVLAKGMKMAKNNETIDVKYRGNNDQESYYITQMALHLVNGAIGGEEDISGLLDQSKNPEVYQKIYALYQDAMAQKEPITDPEGYTKEVTCEILPKTQTVWIKDEKKGGFRTEKNYTVSVSDPARVIQAELSLKGSNIQGVSIIETGDDSFYLHASESAFEQMKSEKDWNAEILWSGQVQEKTGYRYVHLSGEWPGITEYQDLIFLEDAQQPVSLQEKAFAELKVVPEEKGRIAVIKKDSETKKGLKGAVFGIYEEKACKTLVTKTGESDETGKAVTEEFQIKSKGSYFMKELKAPIYHILDQTVTEIPTAKLKEEKTVTYTRENKAQKGKIVLKKEDADPEEKRVEGSLQGAVYLVFAKEKIYKTDLKTIAYEAYKKGDNEKSKSFVTSLKTDKNGKAETETLYLGNYLIFEKTASEGYEIDETIHEVQLTPKNSEQEIIVKEITSKEKKIRGDLELKKTGKKGDDLVALEGAEFTVTAKKNNEKVAVLVTDKNGYATTKKEGKEGTLLYGTYIVTETKAPDGYEKAKPFEVKIEKPSQIYKYEIEDIQKKGKIQIRKIDAETKKTIPIKGASFRILEKKTGKVAAENLKTDQNGWIQVDKMLPFGTYILEEIMPPDGYKKGSALEFTVDSEKMITVVYENIPQKGKVKIKKKKAGSKTVLSDVRFVILAKEDIVTGDGSVRLKQGEIADTIVTDQNGIAVSKELYPGLYEIQEKKQKPGYSRNTEGKEIRIEKDTEKEIELILENHPTSVKIKKTDEELKTDLAGVIFSVWREGEEKKEFVTDKNGEIYLEELVPGRYYLEEKRPKKGYLLSEQRLSFVVDKDGKIEGKSEWEYVLSNKKMKPDIKVAKLANKTTGVTLEDGRYQGEKISGTYTANEIVEYKILITNSGNTNVKEIKVKDKVQEELEKQMIPESAEFLIETGTYETAFGRSVEVKKRSETELWISELTVGDSLEVCFRLQLKEDAQKSEELENMVYVSGDYEPEEGKKEKIPEDEDDWDSDKIKIENVIQVEVIKVDAQTDKPLAGARLAVLKEDGTILDEWISDTEGHRVEGTEVRKVYTLKELEAPSGYEKADSFTFTVLDTGEVQRIVMKDEPEEVPQHLPEETIVKTGDETKTAIYIAGILTSLCMASAVFLKKGRKRK
ncbi:MAG: SpaA isopeptide-forming pilin-related protein [Eubacteriales bacterium]|nr:SpaA isopeptide-forming pilin-related protein [Eubacteriales bacterium]